MAIGLLMVCVGACAGLAAAAAADRSPGTALPGAAAPAIHVRSFQPDRPICRARRAAAVEAVIENLTDRPVEVAATLVVPAGVKVLPPAEGKAPPVRIDARDEAKVSWRVEADAPGECELRLRLDAQGAAAIETALPMNFLPPVEARKLAYIPEPVPVRTSVLIGAHHCPLWEADKPNMWANLIKHPERTPALGFYDQASPEVSDWETKWAVEHGVSFFIYCWYRTTQGGPVTTQFSSAIHDGLLKSRFRDKMKFTIMWENQSRGKAGVADEKDLMSNLLPFWMDNYFTHPSYLKMDDKPVLFIYRPEFLVQDLGGEANVAKAFDRMRQACKDKGFKGLYILGEYRGTDANVLKLLKRLGLDYSFAYCWHVQNNPTPQQAIDAQMQYIRKTQELGILPQVVTVSQAWSGWQDEGTIWKIPPRHYDSLLRQAKDFIAKLPADQLGHRMLLLDNWNEWGEGHYIAPYREYGFGYLDAVRTAFADPAAAEPHEDLIPEDIGMGPYDTAYKAYAAKQDQARKAAKNSPTTKPKP
jgi:hypothetical protein